jgi:uncharacterized protein YrrD
MLLSFGDLKGHKLHAKDGEIGSINDIYFDDATWTVRYLVVNVGSWLTGREVLLVPQVLDLRAGGEKAIGVDLTRAQIRNSPDTDTHKPVLRQHEEAIHSHYGWPLYWGGDPVAGGARSLGYAPHFPDLGGAREIPPPVLEGDERQAEEGDPHLRSAREVDGYRLHALDGEIGTVTDLIVDHEEWRIRYLVVKTGGWFSGDHVLVAPGWIRQLSWPESSVHVNLTRREVAESPPYNHAHPLTRDYEARLHLHYSRQSYWKE